MQITGEDATTLRLGERIALWAKARNLGTKEIAMKARLDVRTARAVLEGGAGGQVFDRLSEAYGWDFIEHVMTPVVGADPITAREREIEHERREIAAREARLQRLRAAVSEDRAGLRVVS